MQHLGLHLHFEDVCNRVDFVVPKPLKDWNPELLG